MVMVVGKEETSHLCWSIIIEKLEPSVMDTLVCTFFFTGNCKAYLGQGEFLVPPPYLSLVSESAVY